MTAEHERLVIYGADFILTNLECIKPCRTIGRNICLNYYKLGHQLSLFFILFWLSIIKLVLFVPLLSAVFCNEKMNANTANLLSAVPQPPSSSSSQRKKNKGGKQQMTTKIRKNQRNDNNGTEEGDDGDDGDDNEDAGEAGGGITNANKSGFMKSNTAYGDGNSDSWLDEEEPDRHKNVMPNLYNDANDDDDDDNAPDVDDNNNNTKYFGDGA